MLNMYMLSPTAFSKQGNVADVSHIGSIMYTSVIWTVNCQSALIITNFTWIQHFFIWGSILLWYIFLYLYGALPPEYSSIEFKLFVEGIAPKPIYWIVTLLVVVVALIPYFLHIVIQRSFYPMDDHVILEMKHCRTDVMDSPVWLREQENSKKSTKVGFSARVDAKILHLKEQLHRKKTSIFKSLINSPIYRTVTNSPKS